MITHYTHTHTDVKNTFQQRTTTQAILLAKPGQVVEESKVDEHIQS